MKKTILLLLLASCGTEAKFHASYDNRELYERYPDLEACNDAYWDDLITFDEFIICVNDTTDGTIQIEHSQVDWDELIGKEPTECIPKGKGKAQNCKKNN